MWLFLRNRVPAVSAAPPRQPETVGLAQGPSQPSEQDGAGDQGGAALPGAPGGQCNIPACEQFYHSFRASDCTYQPYWGGPRRVCDRQ